MGVRVALLFVAALVLPANSLAQSLALDGVWGNEAGCAFAKGGDGSDDSRMLLKADGVETYATLCEWVQVSTAGDGTQIATGLCGHEGEDYRTVDVYIIEKDMADPALVRIRASNGETWGDVNKCP